MLTIRNRRSFVSGLFFVLMGGGFAALSSTYALGLASRMGPGYFPFFLGLVLAALGLFQVCKACHFRAEKVELESWDWRSLSMMTGAVILFAVSMHFLGLIIALALLVVVSSKASHEFTWKGTCANVVVLLGLNLVVFVYGLALPFQLWPTFV
ncbi:membrane protein [Betaproteobacteria bacterium]|nr:membrane protein [Betaproteobacteria bacterium]